MLFGQRGLEIGPRVFPHLSSIVVHQDKISWDKNVITTGFDYGVEIGYSTRINRSVRSGIYFCESGDAFIRDGVYIARKINYVEVPMHFKFITHPFYVYMFSFYIGPQFKMRTFAYHYQIDFGDNNTAMWYARNNSQLKVPDNNAKLNYPETYGTPFINTENLYNQYNIDLSIGLGFDYPLNSYVLFNSYFKYDLSVLNIENKAYEVNFQRFWSTHWTPAYERNRARNFDFGFMFGVTLILPKR